MSNYREGHTRAEKYGKLNIKKCPICKRRSFTYIKGSGWSCNAKDCLYLEPSKRIEPIDHLAISGFSKMVPVPEKDTSDKIKQRIEEVIEKRKNFLKEVKEFAKKHKDELLRETKYQTNQFNEVFIIYILKKENKFKGQKNRKHIYGGIKTILKYYHIGDYKEDYMESPVYNYVAKYWVLVRKALELVLKYGEGYCISIYQSKLEKLTKCQIGEYQINPCNCICEKCGAENLLSANFCSQCGEKMN